MLALHPPIPTRFPSAHLSNSPALLRHHHPLLLLSAATSSSTSTAGAFTASDCSSPSASPQLRPDVELDGDELRELEAPRTSDSASPTSLDRAEFQLAESYRAVPAPLWHSLLKSLCSSPPSTGLAYAVVSWLQKHNLCFSYELLYSILIHALGRSEKLYEAFLLSQRQTLTPLTYNALIGACARNDDLEKALHLMSRMRQDGYQSDFVNYSLIIQSLTRSNKIDTSILQRLYREIELDRIELDAQLFHDVIVGFAKSGDPDRALHFLGVAQGCGLSPKTATLVAVISALGNSGRTLEAEAVFEELKEGGLKPRTRAFNALLKGYVKTGSLRDAEWIVSEMERNGVLPDEHTYSLLIDAYVNAGRWESARILLKEMEASNLQPNSFVFGRILAGYRDKGEWQRTFQVLREMKSCGVRPDRHFYNVMIDTFGKYNCLDHAMDTFDRMLSEGIEPCNVTWNTLIDCHSKAGHHDRAEELFEEMKERGCSPCTTTYNIMINSFGEQQRWEEVKSLLGKMRGEGLLPNVVTYTTLVDIYGQSGRFNDAVDCLDDMKSAGLKPSSTMYNALINAYAQRGMSDQALDAFRLMRADGMPEAFAVLKYMKENNLKPDVVTYTTLMKALIRVDKFPKVPEVYEEMIISGCMPDRKARAMLRPSHAAKAHCKVVSMLMIYSAINLGNRSSILVIKLQGADATRLIHSLDNIDHSSFGIQS
ncbi:hypothetical protein NL676_027481 [Syzygium grande]|nr:hypothetical protein NL676_027481 [Syzygium grande]